MKFPVFRDIATANPPPARGCEGDSDLKLIVQRASGVATLFDADGISVRFMNGKADRDGIRSEADVVALFNAQDFEAHCPIFE